MQTGDLNLGSALKTLPVFSSTSATTLPQDIGIHLMDEGPKDVSSMMAKPSYGAANAFFISAVNGSNGNGHNDVDHHRLHRTTADHSGLNRNVTYHSGLNREVGDHSGLDRNVAIHSGLYRIVEDESGLYRIVEDHSGLYGNVADHSGLYGKVADHSGQYGNGADHSGLYGNVADHYGHYHSSIRHHDEGVYNNGSLQPEFVQEHGEGHHVSTFLEGHSEHLHESSCKCDLCYMNLNEVTNSRDVVVYDSETSHHSRTLKQHFVKDIGTKIRIFQRTPRVNHVQETISVPELCYEERPIVLTKNRVIMVDVEEIEMVPIIKEVKKMKKIVVHKIVEERRNQNCSVPVIEYVRRGTMVRIPRVYKVEEDVEIKVPVIRKVHEKVRVEIPTGEWIENPIAEDKNVNVKKVLNYAKVEAVLVKSKYVDFVMIRLDSVRGHSVALIAANQAALECWAKDFGVGYLDFAELCSKPEARKEVLDSLVQVGREEGLERFKIPTEVRLYRREVLNAFLTVTQKTNFNTQLKKPAAYAEFRDVKFGKVEAVLVKSIYVDFVMLCLDSIRGHSVALIAANQAALERWAKDSGVGYSDFADLCSKLEARKEVLASLIQVATKGAVEDSEIPARVRLYDSVVLNAILTVAQMTKLNPHANAPATYCEIRDVEIVLKYRTLLGGENVKFVKVEAVLRKSLYVDFVTICMDSVRGHSVALVAAKQAALECWAKDSGVGYSNFADLCSKLEARKEVLASLTKVGREGALQSSEVPAKVRLYRGEVLNTFLTLTQTTTFIPQTNTYSQYEDIPEVKELVEKFSSQGGVDDAKIHEVVEAVLRRSPYVDIVILRLDSVSGHRAALVAAKQAALERWAKDSGVSYSDFADLCSKPEARKEVLASLTQAAREGALQSSEIPTEVRLYRREVLNSFLTVTQTATLKPHSNTPGPLSNTPAAHPKTPAPHPNTPAPHSNAPAPHVETPEVKELVEKFRSVGGVEDAKLGKVEAVLRRSPYVDIAVLRLDSVRGHNVALVAAKQAALERWAKDSGVGYLDFVDLCASPEARKEVLGSLTQAAREGALQSSEIPTEVRLYRREVLNTFLTVTQTTTLKPHSNTPPSYPNTPAPQANMTAPHLNTSAPHPNTPAPHPNMPAPHPNIPAPHSNTPAPHVETPEVKELVEKFRSVAGVKDVKLGKVEAVLRRSPYVDIAVLRLDSVRGHNVALVAAKQAALERWAKDTGVGYSDFVDLCASPEARKEVLGSLTQAAREGALQSSEIPTEVRLYRREVLNSFLTVTQTVPLKPHADTAAPHSNMPGPHLETPEVKELVEKFRSVGGDEDANLGKVEAVLRRSPYVDIAVLRQDSVRGHSVALVAAKQAALERWAQISGVGYSDFADLCSKPEARMEVLGSFTKAAREGALQSSEIPTEVRLYRREVLNTFLTVTQTSTLKPHSNTPGPLSNTPAPHSNTPVPHSNTPAPHVETPEVKELVEKFRSVGGVEDAKLGKVEAVLRRSPYVDIAVLRLDTVRGHSVALVAAKQAALERWAKDSGVGYSDFADLCSKPEARKEVLGSLTQAAREGALQSSEIPTEVRLYRREVLDTFLTVTQTATLKPHSNTPAPHSNTPSSHSNTPAPHSNTPAPHSNTPAPHVETPEVKELVEKFRSVGGVEDAKLGKVEAVLRRSPYVDIAVLRLDSVRGHSVALVAAKQAELERWAKESGVGYSGFADLCSKPEARKEVLGSLTQAAREGALQSSEIPTEVRLYRREVLNSFLTVSQTTTLKPHSSTTGPLPNTPAPHSNTPVPHSNMPGPHVETPEVKELVEKFRSVGGVEDAKLGKVEAVLRRSPYVDIAVLRLDSIRGHNVALVAAKQAELERWAKESGVGYSGFADLCSKPEARKEVLGSLTQAAREGALQSSEIPTEVRLYRREVINSFLTVTQTATLKPLSNTPAPQSNTPAPHVETPEVKELVEKFRSVGGVEDAKLGKVEAVLRRSPYVDIAVLRLDSVRGHSVALVAAKQAALERWAKDSGVGYSDFADLCSKPEARMEVLGSLTQAAREGALQSSEIPTEVRLYRREVLNTFLTVTQTTTLKSHSNMPGPLVETPEVKELVEKFRSVGGVEDVIFGKVEAVLRRSPYVDIVVLRLDSVGGHSVALVAAKQAALERWAKESGVGHLGFADLCSKPEACKEVLGSLTQAAREGALQSSEIPTEVRLYRREVLNTFLTVTQTATSKPHSNTPVPYGEIPDVEELVEFRSLAAVGDAKLGKVEPVLRRSPYVDFVMLRLDSVLGDCVALIAANQAALERWAKVSGVGYSDFADLCSKPEARKEVLASLTKVAREGGLGSSDIPSKVRLYRGDVLNTFLTVTQTNSLKSPSNTPASYGEIPDVKELVEFQSLGGVGDPKLGKLEAVLRKSPYVDIVVLRLDSVRGHSIALVAAKQAALERWAKDFGVGYLDFADLCSKPEARKEVLASLTQAAREGALQSSDIPTEVRLYRREVLNTFLTVTQTTTLKSHLNSPAPHVETPEVKELVEKFRSLGGVEDAKLGKVEAVLRWSPYVDFVMLRHDSVRGHNVALIAANQAALERWAKYSGVGFSDFSELCSKREARKEVLASFILVGREGGLEISEIPSKVRICRGAVLNAFLTGVERTNFNPDLNTPATYGGIRDVKLGKVETVLVKSLYVDFVMIRLDSIRGQSVALIAANQAALERWAKDSGVGYSDFADLCSKPEARKEVLASLTKVATEGGLKSFEIPAKVRLYRVDLLNTFLTVTQTTKLNPHSKTPATYWEIRDVEKLVKYRTREGVGDAKLGKVEAVLRKSPYVDFAMLRLDSVRGVSVALVAANQAVLERWAKNSGVGHSDFADLCSKLEARKEVLGSLIQVAKEGALESFEVPAKVRLYRGDVLNAFLAVTQTTKLNI